MPEITTGALALIATGILAYLLGSVPFGIVWSRLFGLGDLRQIGSGNIGATNVLRTGNKPAAFLTLVSDAGKGGVAVLLARALTGGEDAAQIAGLAAFAGHCFPLWLGFKGGKGVATFLGTLIALAWPVGLAACATWLVTALLSRISSLSALVAAASTIVWIFVFSKGAMFWLILSLIALIWWRHAPNIARLRAGTEPKIGQK
ncbi:MAG: glycerol-3-phosphate 1-O-acyltransferase PlsY [Paracoccaceae bacterium]